MPPRRRGQRGAAAAGNAAGPGDAKQAAQAPAQKAARDNLYVPPGAPLFKKMSLTEFCNAYTAAHCKPIAERAARSMNFVRVNVWDLCARKKTNRMKFAVEDAIKQAIFRFIGGQHSSVDPKHCAAFAQAQREQLQKDTCAKILAELADVACSGGLLNTVEMEASDYLAAAGVPANVIECVVKQPVEAVGTVATATSGDVWEQIFSTLLPQLRGLMEDAGYKIRRRVVREVGKGDKKRRAWVLEVLW